MEQRVEPGSKIEVEASDGKYVGVVMERPILADRNHIVLKLDNGYNVGVRLDKIRNIKILSDKGEKEDYMPKKHVVDPNKPTISIIATGGTIASRVDYITGGVHSAYTAEELVSAVPEISEIANVKVKQVFNKFSENMEPSDWIKIAHETYNEIKSGAAGVVITHGTDTMHYTSAALAYMLVTPVPVVITGAQRSSDRGSSDAGINLLDAALVAATGNFGEVAIVMHGEESDSFTLIHPAAKARKMHTSRRDAFRTLNSLPIGRVRDRKIEYSARRNKPRGGEAKIDAVLEENVFLLKYHPGMKPEVLDALVKLGYRGIVIEGTGLGHTSEKLFDSIKKAIDAGVSVAMTSQTLYGRVNMNVYATGRRLLDIGVIPCEDMLPEAAYVKMMWVLGHAKDQKKIKEMMQTNYAGEISDRSIVINQLDIFSP